MPANVLQLHLLTGMVVF